MLLRQVGNGRRQQCQYAGTIREVSHRTGTDQAIGPGRRAAVHRRPAGKGG
jgi:hypothetical protein